MCGWYFVLVKGLGGCDLIGRVGFLCINKIKADEESLKLYMMTVRQFFKNYWLTFFFICFLILLMKDWLLWWGSARK